MSGRGGTAPAFMLYAADLLADKRFRLASLAERGLLLTLLCECWTNNFVPADGADLARYLGIDFEALRAAATERVLSHFAIRETDEGRELFSPGLEKYRQRIEAIRAAQSAGGKSLCRAIALTSENVRNRATVRFLRLQVTCKSWNRNRNRNRNRKGNESQRRL